MHFSGIIIGLLSFLIIGLFHPIVIKTEYYFGKRAWPIFLFLGIFFIGLSTQFINILFAGPIGVLGFTCLWSINELIEQEERVKKGWFPTNPNRK